MAYSIAYKPSAEKSLSRLPLDVCRRLLVAIDNLAENPRPSGVKKLQSPIDLYRIRVGDYRVIYIIEDSKLKILVVAVGHRSDIYS
ncbi:type II toxin-antitoxin system RelE/ParE family toxin [Methylomonas sp. HYX-M1]|uniref:type II toxin-antitoxin system RelE family toxin n=1 Tax=Methylomonas sp. HYX-M1 TaxID=3139307 RepID=UPI00345C13ED